MKIAVTYENGEVFQHFGHTEQFKIYDVEDGRVVSSEIIGSNGSGHGALAALLAEHSIDVLICGGIGGGAQAALQENGVELCAGASGNTDDAVAAYLRGELVNTGANCDHHGEHHHDEGHSCGEHGCGDHGHHGDDHGHHGDDHGCDAGCSPADCGSGCAGCHSEPAFTGKNVGKKVKTHYRGTFNDGTQFDSSYDRGEPLEFVCGAGMMIKGFDAAVANMEVGETVKVHLMPSEAYGEKDPNAIFAIDIADLPGAEELETGDQAYLQTDAGYPVMVTVVFKNEHTITFDANPEMAGKELNFEIELLEVSNA